MHRGHCLGVGDHATQGNAQVAFQNLGCFPNLSGETRKAYFGQLEKRTGPARGIDELERLASSGRSDGNIAERQRASLAELLKALLRALELRLGLPQTLV